MRTLQLKVSDKVFDKIMGYLGEFNASDVEVVVDDEVKAYLAKEYQEVLEGKAKYYSQEEFEKRMDNLK